MKIKIGSKEVGDGCPCYLVAEIGINHNGQFELARKLIETAKACGADAVKFQKRDIDSLITKELADKPYGGDHSFGRTYREHRERLELSDDDWRKLFDFSKKIGIDFYASPWDMKSADFLEDLGIPVYKIASADITNLPLIEHICKKNKPVILSTGMSSLEEIDEAMEIIKKYNVSAILLHCISAYPCENEVVNIMAIQTLRERYKVPVGYSGHEKSGHVVSLAALSMGACMIERHFTLDHLMPGPDHRASLDPRNFENLVISIRKFKASLGNGKKTILECEVPVRKKLAKSIATTRDIKAGETIREADLTAKSPGTGLKPKHIHALIGKVAKRDMNEDTIVPKEALEW